MWTAFSAQLNTIAQSLAAQVGWIIQTDQHHEKQRCSDGITGPSKFQTESLPKRPWVTPSMGHLISF